MPIQFKILGYAGLLPFICIPLLVAADMTNYFYSFQHFVQYSAIILSFFGGIHWYDALQHNRVNHQLYVAMLPSIVGWLGLVFLNGNLLLGVLSCAFIGMLMYDKYTLTMEKSKVIEYTILRLALTTIVVLCHLAMALIA
nr:DUF3429 domain-containing protein [uncultured Glaciecola sp.]